MQYQIGQQVYLKHYKGSKDLLEGVITDIYVGYRDITYYTCELTSTKSLKIEGRFLYSKGGDDVQSWSIDGSTVECTVHFILPYGKATRLLYES